MTTSHVIPENRMVEKENKGKDAQIQENKTENIQSVNRYHFDKRKQIKCESERKSEKR